MLGAALAAALALSGGVGVSGALELLGHRCTPDAGFYHAQVHKAGHFIPRLDAGARLYLCLRNASDAPFEAKTSHWPFALIPGLPNSAPTAAVTRVMPQVAPTWLAVQIWGCRFGLSPL